MLVLKLNTTLLGFIGNLEPEEFMQKCQLDMRFMRKFFLLYRFHLGICFKIMIGLDWLSMHKYITS